MKALVLCRFDPVLGETILLTTKNSMKEEDLRNIPSLMSIPSKGFFSHSFESIKTLNLFFKFSNPLARGRSERFLISIIIDAESNLNNNLVQNLLENFVIEFEKIKEPFRAFDLNSKNYKGDLNKFNEIKNLFFSFYNNIKPTIEALEISELKLKERIKELTSLYELSKLFDIPNVNIETILQRSIRLITQAFQNPEKICGKIIFNNLEYISENYKETEHFIVVDKKNKNMHLIIKIYHTKDTEFLDEEKLLIEEISNRLKVIIEKKKIEQNLINTLKSTRKVLKNLPIGVLIIDNEKKIQSINKKALEILNISKDNEVINDYCYKHNFCHDQSNCPLIEQNEKKNENIEVAITNKQGEKVFIMKSILPITLGDKDFILESIVDITELKKVQQELIESEKIIKNRLSMEKSISKISSKFLTNKPIYESFSESLKEMGVFCNSNVTLLYVFHNENTFIHYYDEWWKQNEMKKKLFQENSPFKYYWLTQMLNMGDFIYFNDVSKLSEDEEEFKELLINSKVKSFLFFPIFIGTSLVGFTGYLNLYENREWTYEEYMLLRSTVEIFRNAIIIKRSTILQEQFNEKLEYEVRNRTKELNEAIQKRIEVSKELHKNSKLKTKLMEIISYELRNSLNVILGFAQLLVEQSVGELNPIQLEYLNDIESSSTHLIEMLKHLTESTTIDIDDKI